MRYLLLALLSAPCAALDFQPLPADTPEAINSNFRTIEQAIKDAAAQTSTQTITYQVNFSSPTDFYAPVTIHSGSSLTLDGFTPTFSSGNYVSLSTLTIQIPQNSTNTKYHCDFSFHNLTGTLAQPYMVFNQANSSSFSAVGHYGNTGSGRTSAGATSCTQYGVKHGALSACDSTVANYVAAANNYHAEIWFHSVGTSSGTFSGKVESEWPLGTGISNLGNYNGTFATAALPIIGLTDIEIFFAANSFGTGGTKFDVRYACDQYTGWPQ